VYYLLVVGVLGLEDVPVILGSERVLERVVCPVCRNVARFCRLSVCPYYRGVYEGIRRSLSSDVLFGPSPPAVLFGEWGYPRVFGGSCVSFVEGVEPGLLESPRSWLDLSIDDLLSLRLGLVLGRLRMPVVGARRPSRVLSAIQESALSFLPVDVELRVVGGFRARPGFGVRAMPHGPSVRIDDVRVVGNVSAPRSVESLVGDVDVSAAVAVGELYRRGVDEYYLSRVFSAGLLGRRAERRLVPTEWSITAIDDLVGRMLLRRVKELRVIGEFRVYEASALFNSVFVVLVPFPWMFELLEGWVRFFDESPYVDFEFYWGRSDYASGTGGAYYAVRLSVLRYLVSRGEQAGAVVFFEVDRGWVPLGVWRFRELTRRALESGFRRFGSLEEALGYVGPRLRIPLGRYLSRSRLVPFIRGQARLA